MYVLHHITYFMQSQRYLLHNEATSCKNMQGPLMDISFSAQHWTTIKKSQPVKVFKHLKKKNSVGLRGFSSWIPFLTTEKETGTKWWATKQGCMCVVVVSTWSILWLFCVLCCSVAELQCYKNRPLLQGCFVLISAENWMYMTVKHKKSNNKMHWLFTYMMTLLSKVKTFQSMLFLIN